MIRFFDIVLSIIGITFFFPIFLVILFFGFFDTGRPLFFQKRIGLNLKNFNVIKFRTMKVETLSKGTHLIDSSNVTFFGYFLRKFKLDELPQFLCVLIGNMSFVGPRPCLPSQKKLIVERNKKGVFKVKPGITGLAQISGINMSTPTLLTKTDLKMIKQLNIFYYFYYIFKTVLLIFKGRS
jgi:lipopolysaccharide/colanic/teichoic acid biosynthesis glycosyltransferase